MMAKLKLSAWQQASKKVAAMSLRERGILALTSLVAVLFLWLQFVFWPIEDQNTRNRNKLATANAEIADQAQRLAELEAALANNPNTPLRAEQARLQQALEVLTARIEKRMSILVPPEQMADLIRKVLADYKGLTLVRAQNLPVQTIQIDVPLGSDKKAGRKHPTSKETEPQAQPEQALLYAHGFEMTLTGGYFQAIEFLQTLETFDGFFWTRFDYQVTRYPEAEMTIQINTLSLDEDWIGV